MQQLHELLGQVGLTLIGQLLI